MYLTTQYLEDSPELARLSPQKAAGKLQQAGDILPITHVLIGWNVPIPVLEACRKVSDRMHAKLIRWHPLLTGDGSFLPKREWQTVNLSGDRIQGYNHMPEFTFVCPNHPEAAGVNLAHVDEIVHAGQYQGLFLDRIRFPSPAANPVAELGCFCSFCQAAAEADGLNFIQIKHVLENMYQNPHGKIAVAQALLGGWDPDLDDEKRHALRQFLEFRARSVTRFIKRIIEIIASVDLEVGLDCFSPGLCQMVGQDLSDLGITADWIKVMSYGHTLGPAGLPFELLGILDFLTTQADLTEDEAINLVSRNLGIPFPVDRRELEQNGLSSDALVMEVGKGLLATSTPILAGIELVDIPGVAVLEDARIKGDLKALRMIRPAGLSISWDLWHIPLHRLELIRHVWIE